MMKEDKTKILTEPQKTDNESLSVVEAQVMPTSKYKIIYADPPWSYKDQGCHGTMANHYQGMSMEEMKRLPIAEIADKDCILFMWTTYPFLKESLELIEAWGFTYKTIAFNWIKKNKSDSGFFFGLGRWTRGNGEPCLLATKGKPKRVANDVSQLIFAPLTKHSAKPPEVRDKIVELCGDIPRVELFARQKAKGWHTWGNELENDIELVAS